MGDHLQRLPFQHTPHLVGIFGRAFGKNHLPLREAHLLNLLALDQGCRLLGGSWRHILLDREIRRRQRRGGRLRQQIAPSLFASVVLVVSALAELGDLIFARALRQIRCASDEEKSIQVFFSRSRRQVSERQVIDVE